MLCTASTSKKNMWHDHITSFRHFDQDMAFTDVDNSEKQAKFKQEEGKQPIPFSPWQSKRPWSLFVIGFSVTAKTYNYGHDVLGDW